MIARNVQPGSRHSTQTAQAPVRRPADRSGASLLMASRHAPADLGPAHLLALQRRYGNRAVQRLIAQRMSAATSAAMANEIHGGDTQSTTAAAQDSDGDVIVYTQSQFKDDARATIRQYLKEDRNPKARIYQVRLKAGTLAGKHAEMALYHNVGDLVDNFGASQKVCTRCATFLGSKGKTYAPTGGKDTKYWWHPEKGETYSSGAMYPTKDATTVTSDRDKW